MPNTPKYLFISHNSKDKPEVIKFAKALDLHPLAQENNLRAWIDIDELHNRTEFPDQLVEAIRIHSCAFALYLTDQPITPWIDTEITHAFKRHVDDQKQQKQYPLIPFYPHARESSTPLPLSLDTMHAIDEVFGDTDKIEHIIKQALGLDHSQATPSSETTTSSNENHFHSHSINYALSQQDGIAYVNNNLGSRRSQPLPSLRDPTFNEPQPKAMSQFLLGDATSWQQQNALLGEHNPKRLRIMTDDPELALLPWHRLQDPSASTQQLLIASGWDIEVSPLIKKPEHLGFSTPKTISNPLIVMPLEAGKEIGTSANRNQIQEHLHEYLGIVGNLSLTHTAYGLQQALNLDPPDLIYLYALGENNEIQLDPDPSNPEFSPTLSLEQLAQWLETTSHRPIIILHLFGRKEHKHYPKRLLDQSSLLWMQQQSRQPEKMIKSLLNVLEDLPRSDKGDIAQLINQQNQTLLDESHLWIKNNTPLIVDNNHGELSFGQLRAALLRVALGRKKTKGVLYDEISPKKNFTETTCIVFAVCGDKTACPHVFPAQLRQRLQWEDRENGLHVNNYDINIPLSNSHSASDMRYDILEANDKCILQGKDDIAEVLASRRIIRNQQTVIMFNWYMDISPLDEGFSDVSSDVSSELSSEEYLEKWITALLSVIQQEFIRAIPDNAVMLCQLCLQAENEDQAQAAQDLADDIISQQEIDYLKPVAIETALGRIKPLELSQFLSKREHWYTDLKLDQSTMNNERYQNELYQNETDQSNTDINPRDYAKWVHQQTQGRFEETVLILWQQYQHDYQEYLDPVKSNDKHG